MDGLMPQCHGWHGAAGSFVGEANAHNLSAYWPHATPSLALAALGTSCSVACATNVRLHA